MFKSTKTNFSNDGRSTVPKQSPLLKTKGAMYRGATVIPTNQMWNNSSPTSFGGMVSPVKFDQLGPLKQSFDSSKSNQYSTELVTNISTIQEKIILPRWEDSGEDTINLCNTFETHLSLQNILDKFENYLNDVQCCDVVFHPEKGEIHGRKWNQKNFDFTSFNIWLYKCDFKIRVKMIRNNGCSFTFQQLLSDTFQYMAKFSTIIDSKFLQPSKTNYCAFGSLPIPTDLDLSLFGLEDLNTGWTEQDIDDIIDELENGYHESIHTSCKQLAKESSSSDDFLRKLCLIPHVIERFVCIVSESQDVLVVRNILIALCNIWNYSQAQSINLYNDFLDSLQKKWNNTQVIQLGQNQWAVDKSHEILRVITKSRHILCSA